MTQGIAGVLPGTEIGIHEPGWLFLELRGVVAEPRKQVEAQQEHIHRLVKFNFGRRVEGPTLFEGMDLPKQRPRPGSSHLEALPDAWATRQVRIT